MTLRFALSLSKGPRVPTQGFDKLSPNGVGGIPIILSLSKDKLSPNGVGGIPNGN